MINEDDKKRILILTQRVDMNDDVLGFFHQWLNEFAKQCEKLTVICLQEGEHDLPQNIHVLSLGKEQNNFQFSIFNFQLIFNSKIFKKLIYTFNFYKYIWSERNNYDQVFVHMNPIYVVLGGLFWRFKGKKIALWYVHKSVDFKLKIAEKLTNIIFTASKEGFQLNSKKVEILGHGIDSSKYICNVDSEKEFDVLYVGRLSKIKNQKLLLETADILVNELGKKNIKVGLVGWFNSDKDRMYYDGLKKFVEDKKLINNIIFAGSKPNKDIVDYYCKSKISVNLSPTGGMDKTVLESMSCGVPVIVFNKTFENILPEEMVLKDPVRDSGSSKEPISNGARELANKILNLLNQPINTNELRKVISDNFSLENLIKNICSKI